MNLKCIRYPQRPVHPDDFDYHILFPIILIVINSLIFEKTLFSFLQELKYNFTCMKIKQFRCVCICTTKAEIAKKEGLD